MKTPRTRPSSHQARRRAIPRLLLAIAGASTLAACGADPVGAPLTARHGAHSVEIPQHVAVCHQQANPSILWVSRAALPAHLAHGDYPVRLEVGDFEAPDPGIEFRRLTDALAAIRAGRVARDEMVTAGCRITVTVAAGERRVSTAPSADPDVERLPFVVDVPDVSVVGALRMQVDETGQATGLRDGDVATTLVPSPALVIVGGTGSQSGSPEPIFIVNAHPNGSAGHGAVIEGFAFRSGRAASDMSTGGFGVLAMRVRDLVLRGNRFEGGFSSAADMRASSATVEWNFLSGRGSSCDLCLSGPGDYVVRGNRIIFGGIPGVLVLPAVVLPVPPAVEQYAAPEEAEVTALVVNNTVRGHLRKPVGVGVRVGAVGVGAANVRGTSRLTLIDNTIEHNTFGLIVEGAFVRDGTTRRGDVWVTTRGNRFSASCQRDLLLSFANSQTGLGLANGPYLLASTMTLDLGADLAWDDAWFAHPAGLGNTLVVNGQEMANGTRRAYEAARVCQL